MTEYKSAKETILGIYSEEELQEIVDHGCAAGCAKNHIYYKETVKFFDDFEHEITDFLTESIGNEFLTETFKNNEGNIQGYKNDIVWTFIEIIAMNELDDEEEDDDDDE